MIESFREYQLDPFGQSRFFGVYKGIALNSDDPEQRKRLHVSVPSIFGNDYAEWAEAVLPPIDKDSIVLPSPGDAVWVMFEGGNPDFPVWIGKR